MVFDGLHETVIKDIVDTIKDGVEVADDVGISRTRNRLDSAKSLSHATEGLILVFPHICSTNVSPETASILTKAIETKAVSLLQIAFSAFNITNSEDAVDFVSQFHKNIGSGKMSVDKFIDTMNSIPTDESAVISRPMLRSVLEEFKRMECYFEEDINEFSLNNFKVVNQYGNYVITEELNPSTGRHSEVRPSINGPYTDDSYYSNNVTTLTPQQQDAQRGLQYNDTQMDLAAKRGHYANQDASDYANYLLSVERLDHDKKKEEERKKEYDADFKQKQNRFDHDVEMDEWKKDMDLLNLDIKQQKNDIDRAKTNMDMLTRQILPSDVKKANEMVPTMMMINFVTRDERLRVPISSQAVIGVKAKLYPASSDDIINKIIVKNADTNSFLKLMRVSTRELNFIRDFLFAIDDAKLSAISCSTKGSDINRLLKILERRAVKGKIRRKLNMRNAYKAITTITISKDEADYIKRYNNIDVLNPSIIRKIMEVLNVMMFIVADDTEECAHIIMDSGEDVYERIAYGHLERESTDGSYKKAINLMTKVVR